MNPGKRVGDTAMRTGLATRRDDWVDGLDAGRARPAGAKSPAGAASPGAHIGTSGESAGATLVTESDLCDVCVVRAWADFERMAGACTDGYWLATGGTHADACLCAETKMLGAAQGAALVGGRTTGRTCRGVNALAFGGGIEISMELCPAILV